MKGTKDQNEKNRRLEQKIRRTKSDKRSGDEEQECKSKNKRFEEQEQRGTKHRKHKNCTSEKLEDKLMEKE